MGKQKVEQLMIFLGLRSPAYICCAGEGGGLDIL